MLRRVILNFLTAISLLLFLSTTTLFIRSFWIRGMKRGRSLMPRS